jgi:hypothetical protein
MNVNEHLSLDLSGSFGRSHVHGSHYIAYSTGLILKLRCFLAP